MNIRTRGRWLAARLRKLERAYAEKPQTTGQISNGVDGGVTSQPAPKRPLKRPNKIERRQPAVKPPA